MTGVIAASMIASLLSAYWHIADRVKKMPSKSMVSKEVFTGGAPVKEVKGLNPYFYKAPAGRKGAKKKGYYSIDRVAPPSVPKPVIPEPEKAVKK